MVMAKNPFAKRNPRDDLITPEDREFISQVYADYEASKGMKPSDDWVKYDEYLEDQQWGTASTRDEWKPKPQVNLCWKVLRTIHANMVSGKTSFNVTCKRALYDDITQQISDVMEFYWDALDMDRKVSEAEWIRPKLGSIIFKAVWDPSLNNGDGDLSCSIVHPGNFFPDPNITNPWDIQKGDCHDFALPKTIKYVANKFCKENDPLCKYTKAELMQILISESSFSDTEIYGDAVTTSSSGRTPTSIVGTDKTFRSLNSRDRVNLHEYWYRDDNYKLQVAWVAGWVLLKNTADDKEMKEEGFYRHGRYPFVIIPYVQKDKRLWGRSEFQSLVGMGSKRDGIQDIVNRLIQHQLVNYETMAQPQKAYRHGAIKDPEKWTGEGNMKIATKGNPHTEIMVLQGATIPGILESIEAYLTHADRITNLWDVTQGRSTPYTKTAGGTMALLEQAMRPQNDVVNTLNTGLRELAEIWLEHLAEFATQDREYVLDQKGQKTFTFNPSELLTAPKRLMDESEQGYHDEPGETVRLYFNIKIDVGASLAITKAYLIELGMQLYERKALDMEGLYKLLPEWPGKQECLERMVAQLEQEKAMIQQQQQQQIEGANTEQPPPEQAPQFDIERAKEFIATLPPEVIAFLRTLSPQDQEAVVMQMMALPPEQLPNFIMQLMTSQTQG